MGAGRQGITCSDIQDEIQTMRTMHRDWVRAGNASPWQQRPCSDLQDEIQTRCTMNYELAWAGKASPWQQKQCSKLCVCVRVLVRLCVALSDSLSRSLSLCACLSPYLSLSRYWIVNGCGQANHHPGSSGRVPIFRMKFKHGARWILYEKNFNLKTISQGDFGHFRETNQIILSRVAKIALRECF